jgi:chitin disaccharide deacetylase
VRNLIVNADDFGYSAGINRGIVECHTNGIVTSTSLMVTGYAVEQAVELSHEHPCLGIGLHWDVWGEDERDFDLDDEGAVRDEFDRQLDAFQRLLGRLPTHVDTHRHAHRKWNAQLMPLFRELVEPLGVPLRDDGPVRFVGDFYAQWQWKVTDLDHVSVPFLERLIREQVDDGWTEISCHPGYVIGDFSSVYLEEREAEVSTLTDPRVRRAVDEEGVRLASYADYVAECA